MKKLLILTTTLAFLMSILYGYTVYQNYIPPFKEGACIEFDYSKLDVVTREERSGEIPVFGSIVKNVMNEGASDVVLVYEMFPGVYGTSLETIPFYNLRLAKAVEVSCGG